jgi:hypothetical protein
VLLRQELPHVESNLFFEDLMSLFNLFTLMVLNGIEIQENWRKSGDLFSTILILNKILLQNTEINVVD